MDVARSAPQGAHYHADVIWDVVADFVVVAMIIHLRSVIISKHANDIRNLI